MTTDKGRTSCTPAVIPGAAPPRPRLGRGRRRYGVKIHLPAIVGVHQSTRILNHHQSSGFRGQPKSAPGMGRQGREIEGAQAGAAPAVRWQHRHYHRAE